jgi:hypothetical protein
MSATQVFNSVGGSMFSKMDRLVDPNGTFFKDLGSHMGEALQGAGLGSGIGGSIFSALGGTNSTGSKIGASVGGALGEVAGKALGKTFSSALGSLGGAAGPLGAIAGGILGSVVGGLFTKVKKASSTITLDANGNLAAGTATGNSGSYKQAATAEANSVVSGLQQIADSLGATVTGAGSVSIGERKGKYVVDTTGSGRTKGAGTQSFADEESAVRAAISDALRDGVLGGISDASKRILAEGGTIETELAKATLIEAVPKDLKALVDPVGAAIDTLNEKFTKTVAALKEGGASADQMAQAQQLYNLELAQTKANTAAADKTLQDFKTSLMLGSGSSYSLRDQEATAKAALQPYLDQIGSGATIDQSAYQDAAQAFLDIERQLYGSTQQYFDALDSIQAATNKAIATVDNVTPIGSAYSDPFASATADSTASTATNTATANDLLAQNSDLLSQAVSLLGQVVGNTGGASGSSFIGSSRGFAAA